MATPTGKSFTDTAVTAELSNAEAAAANAVTQGARADAAATRVETSEDAALYHAQATAPFVDPRNGVTYPKGALGHAQDAASGGANVAAQLAQATSEANRSAAEANRSTTQATASQTRAQAAATSSAEARASAAVLALGSGVTGAASTTAAADTAGAAIGQRWAIWSTGLVYRKESGFWEALYSFSEVPVALPALLAAPADALGAAPVRRTLDGRVYVYDGAASQVTRDEYPTAAAAGAATGGTAIRPASGPGLLILSRELGILRPEHYHNVKAEPNGAIVTEVINHAMSKAQGGESVVVTGDLHLDAVAGNVIPGHAFGGIQLKSGVSLDLRKATLRAVTTASAEYSLVTGYDIEDAEVLGGRLFGDLLTHTGTAGEFGFGVFLTKCARVHLDRVFTSQLWGDGFHVGAFGEYADEVTMMNPIATYCRRQGISVVSARDLTVFNGVTQHIQGTAPAAGIDFEPDDPLKPNERCRIYGLRADDVEVAVWIASANEDVWCYDVTGNARGSGIILQGAMENCGVSRANLAAGPDGKGFWAIEGGPTAATGTFELSDSVLSGGDVVIYHAGSMPGLSVVRNRLVGTKAAPSRAVWMNSGRFYDNTVVVMPGAGHATDWTALFGPAVRRGGNTYENRSAVSVFSQTGGTVTERERYIQTNGGAAWGKGYAGGPMGDEVLASGPVPFSAGPYALAAAQAVAYEVTVNGVANGLPVLSARGDQQGWETNAALIQTAAGDAPGTTKVIFYAFNTAGVAQNVFVDILMPL